MRVSHILRAVRWVRIQGNDVESGDINALMEAIQMQFQTEVTQIDPVQFDGISHRSQQVMFGVNGDLYEFLMDLDQILIQIAQGGLGEFSWTACFVLGFGGCILQPMQVRGDPCVHLGDRGMPTAGCGIAACSGMLDQEFGVVEDAVQRAIPHSIKAYFALLMVSVQPDRWPQERIL